MTRTRSSGAFGLWCVCVLGVIGTLTLPSLQALGTSSSATVTHCVVDVVGTHSTGEFITSELRCHATFAEAVEDITGGVLTPDQDAEGVDVFTDAALAVGLSSFTLAIHYDGYGGSGSSISIVGSSCSGGYWNTSHSWDNRIVGGHEILPSGGHVAARWRSSELPSGGQWFCPR